MWFECILHVTSPQKSLLQCYVKAILFSIASLYICYHIVASCQGLGYLSIPECHGSVVLGLK